MPARLDHTIVRSLHMRECAEFLSGVLGMEAPKDYGFFWRIELADGVCLDYHDVEEIDYQHYALRLSDEEFDALLERMEGLGLEYYAQGHHRRPHEITLRDGGRAIYFTDPDGNSIEIVTRHYVPDEAAAN